MGWTISPAITAAMSKLDGSIGTGVLPGPDPARARHEEVVEDLETNVRRILDFCGLAFEPQCLEFNKTERSERTASSEQVRRPIFKEGLDQWRNFEPGLEPLRRALAG